MDYSSHFNPRNTPQTDPIPGSTQVPNSAGGYSWNLDSMKQLERFLILGTEGGTYYVKEKELTIKNAQNILKALDTHGAVDLIVDVSKSGRAAKNDAALFALALAAGCGNPYVRKAALDSLPLVARTGTHLFTFLSYVQTVRGWGRGLRKAVGKWYLDKSVEDVVYQVIKYRQRNGWTHADALRKAHPKATDENYNALFKWVVDNEYVPFEGDTALRGFLEAQTVKTEDEVMALLSTYRLPWEALPTEVLRFPGTWDSLLDTIPYAALLRNLGRMGSIGFLVPGKWANIDRVVNKLIDFKRQNMVHPISVLSALNVYYKGHGARGSLTWEPVPQVVDALERAFYAAFGFIEPSNKRMLLAVDVSGSMGWSDVSGVPNLTAREAAAVMAMVTVHTEPKYAITGFSHQLQPLHITKAMPLRSVIKYMEDLPFGGTDCAVPMNYALNNGLEIDQFVVYTDSETWAGHTHPAQALKIYRQHTGIDAKLVVVAMCANDFTIADPSDSGMLDVVGFDTATPQLISEFAKL